MPGRTRSPRGVSSSIPLPVAAVIAAAPQDRRIRPRRTVAQLVGDPVLLVLTAVLVVVGLSAVYAATRDSLTSLGGNGARYLKRDALNLAVALVVAGGAGLVGHRRLARPAPVLLALSVAGLVAVLSPLGATINGAKAWFAFGPVQVEPAQVATLALILFAAARLGDGPPTAPGRRAPGPGARSILLTLLAAAAAAGLVLLEPALGIAAVMLIVVAVILTLAGLRGRVLLGGAVVAAAAGVAAWRGGLVKPYQQQRLTAFLHPHLGDAAGYQVLQALTAVGSGGLTGKGFLLGSQTNGGFVPEQQTDFIFTVIAEEAGFIGAMVVLALLTWVSLRALRICSGAVDGYASLVAGGIGMWFALQTFVNVGMAVGVLPVTGIPLPFISYGGSALCLDLVGVALLCSIARESANAGARQRRVDMRPPALALAH